MMKNNAQIRQQKALMRKMEKRILDREMQMRWKQNFIAWRFRLICSGEIEAFLMGRLVKIQLK